MGTQRTNKNVGERATAPGQLGWEERADVVGELTDAQLGVMMAYISGRYPAIFDEVLAKFHPQVLQLLGHLASVGAEL